MLLFPPCCGSSTSALTHCWESCSGGFSPLQLLLRANFPAAIRTKLFPLFCSDNALYKPNFYVEHLLYCVISCYPCISTGSHVCEASQYFSVPAQMQNSCFSLIDVRTVLGLVILKPSLPSIRLSIRWEFSKHLFQPSSPQYCFQEKCLA